jgi:hypothetical protein
MAGLLQTIWLGSFCSNQIKIVSGQGEASLVIPWYLWVAQWMMVGSSSQPWALTVE